MPHGGPPQNRLPNLGATPQLFAGLSHGVYARIDNPSRGCLAMYSPRPPFRYATTGVPTAIASTAAGWPRLLPPGRHQCDRCTTQQLNARSRSTRPTNLRLGSVGEILDSVRQLSRARNGYRQLRFGLGERKDVHDPFFRTESSNEYGTAALLKARAWLCRQSRSRRWAAPLTRFRVLRDVRPHISTPRSMRIRGADGLGVGSGRPRCSASVREGRFVSVQPAAAVIQRAGTDVLVVMQGLHDRNVCREMRRPPEQPRAGCTACGREADRAEIRRLVRGSPRPPRVFHTAFTRSKLAVAKAGNSASGG